MFKIIREIDLPHGTFDEFFAPDPSQERIFMFKQMLSQLSVKAKFVVNTVFNTPTELLEIARDLPLSKNILTYYLVTHKKWKTVDARKAYKEIEKGLDQLLGQ